MKTRILTRCPARSVRRSVYLGDIFPTRRRSVRSIQAIPVPVHTLATAGANDDRWFEEASPDEVCNANGTKFLTEMRDRHPEWYAAMYGDMEP